MEKFNSAAWIKKYKLAIIEDNHAKKSDDNINKKGKAVHSKDLLHTTKVDGKKADKVDIKIGAENDLAIEKDKDGNDVYARGLTENKVKPFQPGDMWSNDFDYVGMLKFGAQTVKEMGLETLNNLYESFTDVNYHTEAKDLGIAIDWMEDMQGIEDEEKVNDLLEDFRAACMKTLKDMKVKWKPSTRTGRNLSMNVKGQANLKNYLANRDL